MIAPNEIISTLEFGSGASLTEEQQYEIQQFHNGRSLQQLVIMPGWEVLMETFEQKKQDATEELLKVNPGDKELVLAAHAVAYAVHQTLDNLKTEVFSSIEYAKQPPVFMTEKLNRVIRQQSTI
jgi:hypothetical protein